MPLIKRRPPTERRRGLGRGAIATVIAAALAVTAAGPVSAATDPDLLLSYDFDAISGTTVPDASGNGRAATLVGSGATVSGDELTLPGGAAGSSAAYLRLPTGVFDGRNTLTTSIWLKNETGAGNYAAMFFGSAASTPSQYWLLNPKNPAGLFKSVITNTLNASAPWGTEAGISPTTAANGIAGPTTSSDWSLYTTVITPTSITGYLNGSKIGTVATTRTVTQFGTGLVGYIGRSSYNDIFYKGGVKDVRVWTSARTDAQIRDEFYDGASPAALDAALAADAGAIGFGDGFVTANLTLPSTGANGSAIAWSSSNPAAIAANGTVTRSAADQAVTLTATLSLRGRTLVRTYPLTVVAAGEQRELQLTADRYDLGITHVSANITLPTTVEGASVAWTSSAPGVIATNGSVTRPAAETAVTLTATFTKAGATATRTIPVTVLAQDTGFVGAGIGTGDITRTDVLFLSASTNGTSYTGLNNNRGLLFPTLGTAKLGNPELFRKPTGGFGLVAPVNSSSTQLYVYDSADLATYTNERLVTFSTIAATRVQVDYDNGIRAYRIRFAAAGTGAGYEVTTKDFAAFTAPVAGTAPAAAPTATYPSGVLEATPQPVTAAEYAFVTERLSRVVSTAVQPFEAVTIDQGDALELPDTATVEYSSGSTTEMGVTWDADDLAAAAQPGTHTVEGTVQRTEYPNPLVERRADPDVTLGDDGWYYFTGSYPTTSNSDPEGYDRIVLRRAQTIAGLKTAPESVLWDEANDPVLNRYIWAPELTKIGDDWYILFTAGRGSVFDIRPAMLKFTGAEFSGAATLDPANWTSLGQMKAKAGDVAFTAFSLDMTYLENQGRHYVAWAQSGVDGSMLWFAEIDPNEPNQLISNAMVLSSPKFAWEKNTATNQSIDEGAAFIKNDGKIIASFSASTVDDKYAVGLLYADEDANLLDPASWQKVQYPVLTSADVPGQVGPGHNSFTVDEFGNPVIVYHSRTINDTSLPGEATDAGLNDPRRHARAATVHWDSAGLPVFNLTADEELAPSLKRVQVQVTVNAVAPALQITATASARCVAGKAVLTVTAVNNNAVPVAMTLTSAYGTKSFAAVAPGKNASAAFTTRLASLPAGSASVTATAGGDTVTVPAAYPALTCN
ncbi:family 43 glycosylhydrolase [Microbacteriaceae bacterium VKM Ac-2854]|nr:family 43 glycosylhydrolase [Microbacteriaceae bacterium VKM Ac-2854]